mgnify:CR=1 FL=1
MLILIIAHTLCRSWKDNDDRSIGNVQLILLTPDCMKRLCMSSRTKKAEEVRTYFIELEKHIDKYKNYIIDGLSVKVGNLETQIKPIYNPKKGVIYVLDSNADVEDVYKLGKSKEFKNRLKVFTIGFPY